MCVAVLMRVLGNGWCVCANACECVCTWKFVRVCVRCSGDFLCLCVVALLSVCVCGCPSAPMCVCLCYWQCVCVRIGCGAFGVTELVILSV